MREIGREGGKGGGGASTPGLTAPSSESAAARGQPTAARGQPTGQPLAGGACAPQEAVCTVCGRADRCSAAQTSRRGRRETRPRQAQTGRQGTTAKQRPGRHLGRAAGGVAGAAGYGPRELVRVFEVREEVWYYYYYYYFIIIIINRYYIIPPPGGGAASTGAK